MNVLKRRSLPWILGAVAVVAVVAGVMIGLTLSGSSTQATAQIPNNPLAESVAVPNPVDASLAPGAPEFATVVEIEGEGGEPAVSGQQVTPARVEICYTDAQTNTEECRNPSETRLLEDWNPIRTQHKFTVKVWQANGARAANVPVEIILNRFGEAVGDIVSIDRGSKVDNHFGNVTTDPSGEAEFVITSTRAGDTDVTAYVPGIEDDKIHKVFAVKHWVDMDVHFPGDATNPAGQDHEMIVLVFKPTAGVEGEDAAGYPIPVKPLENVTVDWLITDNDPPATLTYSTRPTNANGQSVVTLQQVVASQGDNEVAFQVRDETGRVMFEGSLTKTWIAQELHISKVTDDTQIGLLGTAQYTITITNGGSAPATGLTLTDIVPVGMTFVSANPTPTTVPAAGTSGGTITWSLPDLAADGGSTDITITLQGSAVGTHRNAATATSGDSTVSDYADTEVVSGELDVAKDCEDADILINNDFTCTITVTNSGIGALTSVTLTDTPGNDLVFRGSTPVATDRTWNLGTLMPNDSETVTVTLQGPTTGTKTNTASVTSAEGKSGRASDTVNLIEQGPAIHFQIVDNPGRIAIGETSVLTATIVNQDTEIGLSNVMLDITVPDSLSIVGFDAGGTQIGQVVTFDMGSIGTGQTVNRTVTVSALQRGQHRIDGQVTATQLAEPFPAFQFITIVGQ